MERHLLGFTIRWKNRTENRSQFPVDSPRRAKSTGKSAQIHRKAKMCALKRCLRINPKAPPCSGSNTEYEKICLQSQKCPQSMSIYFCCLGLFVCLSCLCVSGVETCRTFLCGPTMFGFSGEARISRHARHRQFTRRRSCFLLRPEPGSP